MEENQHFAYGDISTAVCMLCIQLEETCSPMAWSLLCMQDLRQNGRLSACKLRHMTSASAVFSTRRYLRIKQLADFKQRKRYVQFSNMLGQHKTKDQAIVTVTWSEQVALKRGIPRKKLTYLHEKRTNAETIPVLYTNPRLFMYGVVTFNACVLTGLPLVTLFASC